MIKKSVELPEVIPDGTDPQALVSFLVAVKQSIDELYGSADSIQSNVMASVPTAGDFDTDNQTIIYDDGTNRRLYKRIKGQVIAI